MKGNKPKLLKTILHKFISKPCFAMFTWTGKAGKGQARKTALRDYSNILEVLRQIVEKLEGSYKEDMFLSHLKNVIKGA